MLYLIWYAHTNSFRHWTADSCEFVWLSSKKSQYSIYNQKGQQVFALQKFQNLSKNVHVFCHVSSLTMRSALELKSYVSYCCCGLGSSYLGKYVSARLNFVDFVKPSCPWVHGRLNINRSTFAPSHPPTSVTLRLIIGISLTQRDLFWTKIRWFCGSLPLN